MDIVDMVVQNKQYSKGTKLRKLYAVIMLNYRQALGDKAWEAVDKVMELPGFASDFAYLAGLITGAQCKLESWHAQIAPDEDALREMNSEKL